MTPFISLKFRFFSFLAMLLLVYVHGYNLEESYLQPFTLVHEPLRFTTFTEYFIANGLLRFRVPMLFVISGYLFALGDEKPYGERVLKRARTLLLPYLLWSALALLLTFVLQQFPLTAGAVADAQLDQLGDNRPYTQIGWGGMATRWILAPVAFQLWFVRCLFMYNVLYPLLRQAVLRQPAVWFTIAGILWYLTMGFYLVEGEGLLFFSLGIWMAKRGFDLEQAPRWLRPNLMIPVFLGICVVKTLLAFTFHDYNAPVFFLMSFLHKAAVFTGLVALWYGFDNVVRYWMDRKWFVWFSGFSFIIYAMHVPLVNYATELVMTHAAGIPMLRLLTFAVLPLLIIAVCVFSGALLRRLVPSVYSVLTGGRGLG